MLLIVLLLLAIAGVSLAAACRATLRQSAAASAAVADLQQRWGSVTAQYAVLDNAANVLDLADAPGRPAVTLRSTFDLGRLRFDVELSDEQAKANVNGLLAWRGRAAAEGAIRDLARSAGAAVAPRLPGAAEGPRRPHAIVPTDADDEPAEPEAERVPPTFGRLTEVFPAAAWDDLRPAGGVGRWLTCAGDGRVNVRRAPVAVLSAACAGTSTTPGLTPAQAARLAARARDAGPSFDVAAALAGVGAAPAAAMALQARLCDGSFAQSAWVTATDGRRTWRSWAVRDSTDAEHPRTVTGQW